MRKTTPTTIAPGSGRSDLATLGAEFLTWSLISGLLKIARLRRFLFQGGVIVGLGSLGIWAMTCYERSDKTAEGFLLTMGADVRKTKQRAGRFVKTLREVYDERYASQRGRRHLISLPELIDLIQESQKRNDQGLRRH